MAESSGPEIARLKALIARQRRELDAVRSSATARSVIDVATGMLMEQLHCSPAQARRQLDRPGYWWARRWLRGAAINPARGPPA